MNYEELSEDSKEALKGMAFFCIERGYCMGQDEGFLSFGDGSTSEIKHDFRIELEKFCGFNK